MAAISDSVENSIMNLVFRAVAWANYADNAAGTPQTNVDVALHTASPGDAGSMSTSESSYASYARVQVARTTGGWSAASGGSINPAANIDFPSSTGSGTTVTDFSTGKTGGGAAIILWYGGVSPSITIGGSGVTPRLTTATQLTID